MRPRLRTAGLAVLALGVALAFVAIALWAAGGASTGWTKTYVEVMKTDEITGIEYPERVKRLVPGLDFLVPGVGVGIVCIFAGTAILRVQRNKSNP